MKRIPGSPSSKNNQLFRAVLISVPLFIAMFGCPNNIYAFRNPLREFSLKPAKSYELKNDRLTVFLTSSGIEHLYDNLLHKNYKFAQDGFSVTINGQVMSDKELSLTSVNTGEEKLVYQFDDNNYTVKVIYELKSSWAFISKQLEIKSKSNKAFKVDQVCVLNEKLGQAIKDDYSPKGWWPGYSTKNYGAFLRFGDQTGLITLVQNPFLDYVRNGESFSLTYSPDMDWDNSYGNFFSDRACIGAYALTGRKILVDMVPEWKWTGGIIPDGVKEDEAEVHAFTDCVEQFIQDHTPKPINVHVAWCENDYQEDVSMASGREVYKRIIDQAVGVGSKYIVYTPTTSDLGTYVDAADSWKGECFLWLGLGIKFRKNEWSPSDTIPASIQELLDYAKKRDVKLLAYVYPGMPFQQNKNWLISTVEGGITKQYANLGFRDFQDWLISQLIAFMEKTGVGGYSFDYTFLNYPGKSVYAQWKGWCRVLEALRSRFPDIVIDGRQTYQYYGPWSWVAGSYPHPTSTDEQPESFVPFPDLHFDRSSADRERYTTFRYRIRDYCPSYLMPGYITHQTPRFNLNQQVMREPFRIRDWDYLGWKYSLISSIAMGGLNNVINMIPARDPEEFRLFSDEDKAFFRKWLGWTRDNRSYLEHAKPILGQPAIGKTDGVAAIMGTDGYIFLYNPNGRKLPAKVALDESINLGKSGNILVKELFPREGMLIGKPGSGTWKYGDTVNILMDGASAMILRVEPLENVMNGPLLFNVPGNARLQQSSVYIDSVSGEKGQNAEAMILLSGKTKIDKVYINNAPAKFKREGNTIAAPLHFEGAGFSHMEQAGKFDAAFAGGTCNTSFTIPQRIFDQLKERSLKWPVSWYETDVETPYLLPHRLLLFVQIAEPLENMNVQMKINDKSVELKKAYSSLRQISHDFLGFYVDISSFKADENYNIELQLPSLKKGQFQGLFFENIETEYTDKIVAK